MHIQRDGRGIDERREVAGIALRGLAIIAAMRFAAGGPVHLGRHETERVVFVVELVEGEFEVRRGDQADEHAVLDDGHAAVELACHLQQLLHDAQLGGGDQAVLGDVDDAVVAEARGDVAQLRGEDGADFVVQEGVRVHVREEVVDAEGLDGVGGPFGDQDAQGEGEDVVEAAGQLEEDDGECDREARDACHGCAGCHKSVHAGDYTRSGCALGLAFAEDAKVVEAERE